MSVLYLIRHGQAGTREHYDTLSELGRAQARLLGEHLAAQGVRFDRVIAGGLSRQQQTAREALAALETRPEIETDAGWNEFDLAGVYAGIAPQLCEADPEFRRQYEDMQAQIEASKGAHGATVHRKWNECDKTVVRTWVDGRYAFDGESWEQFQGRVEAAFQRLQANGHEEHIAVFTSATPIGIAAAQTLAIRDGRVFQFAGVLHNAALSTFRRTPAEVRLFTFNNVAHLSDPAMRTFR